MDAIALSRLVLPLFVVGFAVFAMILPVMRLHRETGRWGITLHRETQPGQRLVGVSFLAIQLGLFAIVALYATRGPEGVAAWRAPPAIVGLGLILAVLGIGIVCVAQRQMGASLRIGIDEERTALVRHGLFQVVRNPIFSGLLLSLAGVALVALGPWMLLLWSCAAVTIAYQTRLEERHLLAQHGDAYRSYADQVGRFLPGVGRLRNPPRAAP